MKNGSRRDMNHFEFSTITNCSRVTDAITHPPANTRFSGNVTPAPLPEFLTFTFEFDQNSYGFRKAIATATPGVPLSLARPLRG